MALGDVYSQQAFAPSQQLLQQQTQAAQALPGLHQQGIAIKEQEIEQARLNRPITPWQRAAMELASGGDPKVIAARLKAETGGAIGAPPGGQGAPSGMPPPSPNSAPGASLGAGPAQGSTHIPPAVSQAIFGSPQSGGPNVSMPPSGPGYGVQTPMSGQQDRDMFAAQMRGSELPVDMTGMQRPMQGQLPMRNAQPVQSGLGAGAGEDIYAGMNGRDFRDYMANVAPIAKARYNAREQRDRLAEISLENRGKADVANINAGSREKVAEARLKLDRRKMEGKEYADELERRIKKEGLDEKTAHHAAQIKLGYDKLQELKQRYSMARTQKDRLEVLKILAKREDTLIDAKAKIMSSLTGLAGMKNEDLRADLQDMLDEIEEAEKMAKDELKRVRESGEVSEVKIEKKGETEKGPVGRVKLKNKKDGRVQEVTMEQWKTAKSKDDWEEVKE